MELIRHDPQDAVLADILSLIRTSFAYMDGRIDPPSSMHRLTLDAVRQQASAGEIWSLGAPPVACVFLTPQADALYVGKLSVAQRVRGQGYARQLIDLAAQRAKARGLSRLRLESRVELHEVHAVFRQMGFAQTGTTAHPGYSAPTSITFTKRL